MRGYGYTERGYGNGYRRLRRRVKAGQFGGDGQKGAAKTQKLGLLQRFGRRNLRQKHRCRGKTLSEEERSYRRRHSGYQNACGDGYNFFRFAVAERLLQRFGRCSSRKTYLRRSPRRELRRAGRGRRGRHEQNQERVFPEHYGGGNLSELRVYRRKRRAD